MPVSLSSSTSRKIASTISAYCLLAVLAVSLAAPAAVASGPDKSRDRLAAAHHAPYAKFAAGHRHVRLARRRWPDGAYPYIPPNAIRMPGYVFVPGVGILGESCDLPTSACPNEYRDVQ